MVVIVVIIVPHFSIPYYPMVSTTPSSNPSFLYAGWPERPGSRGLAGPRTWLFFLYMVTIRAIIRV